MNDRMNELMSMANQFTPSCAWLSRGGYGPPAKSPIIVLPVRSFREGLLGLMPPVELNPVLLYVGGNKGRLVQSQCNLDSRDSSTTLAVRRHSFSKLTSRNCHSGVSGTQPLIPISIHHSESSRRCIFGYANSEADENIT